MKRLRDVELILLAAIAIAGCSAIPGTQTAEVVPSASAAPLVMPAKSCVERSADAVPPKNPIVELAWCIAETDELYDSDHLFKETLGIKKYGISEGIVWGVQAGAYGKENPKLPKGVSFLFMRKDPKGPNDPGNRYLSIDIDHQKFCVRRADIAATFGEDSWLSAVPVFVFGSVTASKTLSISKEKKNPYGIFFKSPRLFMRDASGSVDFFFQYGECITHLAIQRNLEFIDYRNYQKGEYKK
jgi:hypothetical protein